MRAVPAARDGSRLLLLHPWRSQHPWPQSSTRVRARCTRRWCARWGRRTDHRHRQLPLSITISAPARTRASRSAQLLAASAFEMWITWSAMARLYRHSSSPDSASKAAGSAFCCASSFVGWMSAGGFFSSAAPGCVAVWICLRLRIDTCVYPSVYTRVLTDRCDQASAGCNGYRSGLRASTSPWGDGHVTGPALAEIGSFDAFPRQRAQAVGMKRPAFDAEKHRAIVRVAGQLRTRLAPIFVDSRDARRKINYGGWAAPSPRI